jgi:hypothetical protein
LPACAFNAAVGVGLHDLRLRLDLVLGQHALAVNIGHQHHVIIAGDARGARDVDLRHAHPVRHHHQPGTRGGTGIVVNQHAAESVVADLPFDRTVLHCSECRGDPHGKDEGGR